MSKNIEYQVIDWNKIQRTEHPGQTGVAHWQTLHFANVRVRIVEYSKGYRADHWCQKGHLVHCLEGELVSEQQNGDKQVLKQGMTYIVSDDRSTHRSSTETGVRLVKSLSLCKK
jgi:hypothetical protein